MKSYIYKIRNANWLNIRECQNTAEENQRRRLPCYEMSISLTRRGSFFTPSINSSKESLSSQLRSIWLKIESVRSSGSSRSRTLDRDDSTLYIACITEKIYWLEKKYRNFKPIFLNVHYWIYGICTMWQHLWKMHLEYDTTRWVQKKHCYSQREPPTFLRGRWIHSHWCRTSGSWTWVCPPYVPLTRCWSRTQTHGSPASRRHSGQTRGTRALQTLKRPLAERKSSIPSWTLPMSARPWAICSWILCTSPGFPLL